MATAMESSGEVIMGYLAGLGPLRFSDLAVSLAADLRLQQQRLLCLVLSPLHFSNALSFLHSLSLPQKTLLLARLLLRSLRMLLLGTEGHIAGRYRPLRLREFDAALLLLTMCEAYEKGDSETTRGFDWRDKIARQVLRSTLSSAGLGEHVWSVVARYVDAAAKCRRLLEAIVSGRRGALGKAEREVGASVAAVVALESVEPFADDQHQYSCAICTEEMKEVGREVCRMPCGHLFHWICVLPWLRKNNSCPCCRFELPTDDVFYEIERLWRRAASMSGSN